MSVCVCVCHGIKMWPEDTGQRSHNLAWQGLSPRQGFAHVHCVAGLWLLFLLFAQPFIVLINIARQPSHLHDDKVSTGAYTCTNLFIYLPNARCALPGACKYATLRASKHFIAALPFLCRALTKLEQLFYGLYYSRSLWPSLFL